jgi:hypothetical protein
MKKPSFETTLYLFYGYMTWDIDLLVKIERAKHIVKSRNEKRAIFEAFVFRICANWEILVEDLFIDCFSKDTSMFRNFTGFKIDKHLSRETCKAIILGTHYVDFKSIDDLKKQASRAIMPQCNPFKEIPNLNGSKIDEFFTIRNYLAHYSDAARRSLAKIYKEQYGLRRFIMPGQFLLTRDKKSDFPRMAIYINNFTDTADLMAKFLGIEIKIDEE